MADKLDPQVQVHIIDLAWEMAKGEEQRTGTPQTDIKQKTELFDQAYKAIVKTVTS